ncbi:hypothetical protein Acr_26g0003250 [Actinidia rufa]|uniref:C2H2-type domain-containing protein n=1 Tax=Actinidia rufa TaxID=165716 RepID=A0A7J0H218_9ERIC|nr:hypothetical protein Acr_26g0003250 [Actinidia rufa]
MPIVTLVTYRANTYPPSTLERLPRSSLTLPSFETEIAVVVGEGGEVRGRGTGSDEGIEWAVETEIAVVVGEGGEVRGRGTGSDEGIEQKTYRAMAEARRESVMLVELAILRELAYRKKLASLRLLLGESMENLMPLQVPSPRSGRRPSPTPSTEPSSISGSSMSLIPTSSYQVQASSPCPGLVLKPNQFPNPRPGSSSITCPSKVLVPHPLYHLSTSNRHPSPMPLPAPRQTQSQSSSARPGPSQIPGPSSLARPGPSQIPGPGSLARHSLKPRPSLSGITSKETSSLPCALLRCCQSQTALKGHKHKTTLQWLKMSKRDGGGREDPKLHCELCRIWCMNKDALEMHMRGQKHQAKLQELEFGRKNAGEREAQRPWCELCQIWCMNEDAFQQHLKGKNHVTRLYVVEEQKRANGELAKMEWRMFCTLKCKVAASHGEKLDTSDSGDGFLISMPMPY